MKICKNCGKEYEGWGVSFCSKSCASKYRADEAVRNGTSRFLEKNNPGWHSQIAKSQLENGTHPFLNQNKSDEFKANQSKGISEARKREAESGNHPFQSRLARINNTYKSYLTRGSLDDPMVFYIAKCKDYPDWTKIGTALLSRIPGRFYQGNYSEVKFYKLTRKLALDAEREVKLWLHANNYCDEKESEWCKPEFTSELYSELPKLLENFISPDQEEFLFKS